MFGCAAFAHQYEGKLEPRAVKCVMLGYPEGVKGYRLWVLGVQGIKIINSRNIVFNESEMPCLKQKTDETNKSETEKSIQTEVKLTKLDSPTPGNEVNDPIHQEPENEDEAENETELEPEGVTELQENIEPVEVEHFNDQPPNQDYQLTRDRGGGRSDQILDMNP